MGARWAAAVLLVCATAHAQLADPDTEAARRHFLRGDEEYQAGRYPSALREFELGRAIKPLPAFDFDIARCLDRLERWSEAADAYERYLTAAPDVADAAALRERARSLRARSAPRVVPPVLVPMPLALRQPAPARPSHPLRDAAIGVGAATVALGIAGGALLGTVESDFRDAQAGCRARACGPSDWAPLEARADTGYALLGLAGAAAIVDLILAARAARRP